MEVVIIRYKTKYKHNGIPTKVFDKVLDVIPFEGSLISGYQNHRIWFDPENNEKLIWEDITGQKLAYQQVLLSKINLKLTAGVRDSIKITEAYEQIKQIRREKRLKKLLE